MKDWTKRWKGIKRGEELKKGKLKFSSMTMQIEKLEKRIKRGKETKNEKLEFTQYNTGNWGMVPKKSGL